MNTFSIKLNDEQISKAIINSSAGIHLIPNSKMNEHNQFTFTHPQTGRTDSMPKCRNKKNDRRMFLIKRLF